MYMFKAFLVGIPWTLRNCMLWRNFLLGILAGGLTYVCVETGFDWWYFEHSRGVLLLSLSLPAAVIGFFIPIVLPTGLYLWGTFRKKQAIVEVGVALANAGITAWFLSSFLKALTGRLQPEFYTQVSYIDISNVFQFGFFRHGIFWGWPSSHTTVAVAMSVVIIRLWQRNRAIAFLAALYAMYIALGVSVSIHWFSDALAGLIFGIIVGMAVALPRRN